jgi:hypothetical protein
LEVGVTNLALPAHLEAALGTREIPAAQFAVQWQTSIEEQSSLLEQASRIRSPRELLRFLAGKAEGPWEALAAEYAAARETLKASARRAAEVQTAVNSQYDRLGEVKRLIVQTEREKGGHFRATVVWTSEDERRRETLHWRIQELLEERRRIRSRITELKATRLQIEREGEAGRARKRTSQIEVEAEMARLGMVRNAILAIRSLPHTEHRPTAWWIPMVDRSGRWFRRIVETTELYCEPLLSPVETA